MESQEEKIKRLEAELELSRNTLKELCHYFPEKTMMNIPSSLMLKIMLADGQDIDDFLVDEDKVQTEKG